MTQNVCVKCQAQYQPKKLGVMVIETAGNPPKAYRIWRADMLACPICGAELITAFSHEPVVECHEIGFSEQLKNIPAGSRFVMHNPEYLVQTVGFDTRYVRSHEH